MCSHTAPGKQIGMRISAWAETGREVDFFVGIRVRRARPARRREADRDLNFCVYSCAGTGEADGWRAEIFRLLLRARPGEEADKRSSFSGCSCARARPEEGQAGGRISAFTLARKPGPGRQMESPIFAFTLARARWGEADRGPKFCVYSFAERARPGEGRQIEIRISASAFARARPGGEADREPNFCVYSCARGEADKELILCGSCAGPARGDR